MWTLALMIPDGLAWATLGLLGSAGLALAAWLLNKVAGHDTRIAVIEVVLGLKTAKEKE